MVILQINPILSSQQMTAVPKGDLTLDHFGILQYVRKEIESLITLGFRSVREPFGGQMCCRIGV